MQENKPVIQGGLSAAALISLFQAILQLGRVSGWWDITEEVTQAWIALIQIAMPILVIAVTTWWTARRTTSLSLPTDEDGVRLVRAEPHHPPAKQEVRSIERALFDGKGNRL
jgi:hypothetical protein